jgi:hypothetical protein
VLGEFGTGCLFPLLLLGDGVTGAEESFRTCLHLDKGMKEAWLNYSGLLIKLERESESLKASPYASYSCVKEPSLRWLPVATQVCEEGLDLHPDYGALMVQLNQVLRLLGRQEEAIAQSWARIMRDAGALASEPTTRVPPAPAAASAAATGEEGPAGGTLCFTMVKWGTKYGPCYVNKLVRAIRRNLPGVAEFVCLTDDPSGLEGVRCVAIPHDLPLKGWWTKALLFSDMLGLARGEAAPRAVLVVC